MREQVRQKAFRQLTNCIVPDSRPTNDCTAVIRVWNTILPPSSLLIPIPPQKTNQAHANQTFSQLSKDTTSSTCLECTLFHGSSS
uniref:Uncharacterized protein n=1 Tax=Hordeum vulgare subsp. vulgare TaxID=112509 RepID=A0A8I6XKC2_HORVV